MTTTLIFVYIVLLAGGGALFLRKFRELMILMKPLLVKKEIKTAICQKALLMAVGFGIFVIAFGWLLGFIHYSYIVMIGG